jgi:valyl-tRNA synthetase
MDAGNRHHRRVDEETNMLTEAHNSIYEFHWMRHADRYLALVRTALEKDPNDLELRELLEAMEAAVAAKQRQPLH